MYHWHIHWLNLFGQKFVFQCFFLSTWTAIFPPKLNFNSMESHKNNVSIATISTRSKYRNGHCVTCQNGIVCVRLDQINQTNNNNKILWKFDEIVICCYTARILCRIHCVLSCCCWCLTLASTQCFFFFFSIEIYMCRL